MANQVSAVILTIPVPGPKGTNIIRLEEVLIHGSGTLTEAIEGGTAKYGLTLEHGKVINPPGLRVGDMVSVQGDENGVPFKLPIALKTIQAERPWKFEGQT